MYKWRTKALITLCACAGWSESAHCALVQKHFPCIFRRDMLLYKSDEPSNLDFVNIFYTFRDIPLIVKNMLQKCFYGIKVELPPLKVYRYLLTKACMHGRNNTIVLYRQQFTAFTFEPRHSISYNIACAPSEASRKHAYIILTPLKPHFQYSKTGVYSRHYFCYFCSKI